MVQPRYIYFKIMFLNTLDGTFDIKNIKDYQK